MYRLVNSVREYAWGSPSALAELLGRPAGDGRREAELWLGAHPAAASRVLHQGGGTTPLPVLIAADPLGQLGPAAGLDSGRLPFLLKVLAVAAPLSLQVHPDKETAVAGFAADQSAGLALDDPNRRYQDRNAKPELLCALTPFRALCGLRPVDEVVEILDELAVPELKRAIDDFGRGRDDLVIRGLLGSILRAADPAGLVGQVVDACRRLAEDSRWAPSYRCAMDLAQRYPDDPGVVVPLLMNLVTLAPGEAMYLPAGQLHAYLEGVGVEVMACSDNVLRGGLTSKHVDVEALLGAVECTLAPPARISPVRDVAGWSRYPVPAPEFELGQVRLTGGCVRSLVPGPQLLLCLEGGVVLDDHRTSLELTRGQSAFVPAGAPLVVSGTGVVVRASIGEEIDIALSGSADQDS